MYLLGTSIKVIILWQGTVLVVIVSYLDLHLPMQSVPIITDVSSNLDQGRLYEIMW